MSLSKSPATILQALLVAEEVFGDPEASSPTWPCFVGFTPDASVDDVGTVYDTAGYDDGRLMPTGEYLMHHGVQIRVRAQDYDTAWSKISEVAEALKDVVRADVEIEDATFTIHNVKQAGPPLSLGVEEGTKRRSLFVLNCLMTIEEQES